MSARPEGTVSASERAHDPGAALRRILLMWILLLLIGAAELLTSYLPLAPAWRPVLLVPAVLMVIVVAVGFMEVCKGPAIIRAFAVASLFWLLVLLALGSADPLTRTNYLLMRTHDPSSSDFPRSTPAAEPP
jgi:hypothetical protein